ncbi:hypothetical protein IW262DRAFT_1465671 [Armillaria fumosa]|nr:hypothetical protein IW262DRAFT_1465671 [Armillaria fumosa]
MSTMCTICLCDYTEPISIPRGHVYCLKCISDHILSSSPDGFVASCPTCRISFCIGKFSLFISLFSAVVHPILVLLDPKSLPTQFHRYIIPSIQRVFVEPDAFKRRLDALETRNAALERENCALVAAVAKGEERSARNEKQFKVPGREIARLCKIHESMMPPSKRPINADSSSSMNVPTTARYRSLASSSADLQAFARAHSTKRSAQLQNLISDYNFAEYCCGFLSETLFATFTMPTL